MDDAATDIDFDPSTRYLTLTPATGTPVSAGPLPPEERLSIIEELLRGTGYDLAPVPLTPTGPPESQPELRYTPLGIDETEGTTIDDTAIGRIYANALEASSRDRLIVILAGIYGVRPFELVRLTIDDVRCPPGGTGASLAITGINKRRRRLQLDRATGRVLTQWLDRRAELLDGIGADPTDGALPLIISISRPHTAIVDHGLVSDVINSVGQSGQHGTSPSLTPGELYQATARAIRVYGIIERDLDYYDPCVALAHLVPRPGQEPAGE